MATDNELLTDIRDALLELIDVEKGDYDTTLSTADASVTDVLTVVEPGSSTCSKRIVINTGDPDGEVLIDVYEDGKLVAKDIPPGEQWVSDLDGGGDIAVQCAEGLATTCTITSYLRNT